MDQYTTTDSFTTTRAPKSFTGTSALPTGPFPAGAATGPSSTLWRSNLTSLPDPEGGPNGQEREDSDDG
jgi:hypothetical protein